MKGRRFHVPLGARIPGQERRRRTLDESAELVDRLTRDVLASGAWRELLPLPIDGLVLVPSRSTEHGDHEVRLVHGHQTRHVAGCTGPCGAHPVCWHRIAAGLAVWQAEHPDWDIGAVCDPETGVPHGALVLRLIGSYLAPPPRDRRSWQARVDGRGDPEARNTLPAPDLALA